MPVGESSRGRGERLGFAKRAREEMRRGGKASSAGSSSGEAGWGRLRPWRRDEVEREMAACGTMDGGVIKDDLTQCKMARGLDKTDSCRTRTDLFAFLFFIYYFF